jgi:hypothetical protein
MSNAHAMAEISRETHEVEDILDSLFFRDDETGQYVTRFKVRWVGYESDSDTLEPIENLGACVVLMHKFLQRKRAAYRRRGLQADKRPPWALPPLGQKVCSLKKATEFIPRNTDRLRRIHMVFNNDGVEYMTASFFSPKKDCVHVRKCVMDYYYAVDVLRFLKKMGRV